MSELSEWVFSLAVGAILLFLGIGLLIFIFSPSGPLTWFPKSNNNQQVSTPPISAIYLSEDTVSKINSKYNSENVEFRYCLFGKSYKNGVLITDINEPKYRFQSTTSLVAEDCSFTSMGFLHSHPIKEGNCLLSSDDINTFNSGSDSLLGVICENNRIAIYTKENTKNFIPIYTVSSDDNPINLRNITPQTACAGERYCNGQCWGGCDDLYHVWHCTPNGGDCKPDPNNCPSGTHSCLGTCYDGCAVGGVFSCTPNGGNCHYYR